MKTILIFVILFSAFSCSSSKTKFKNNSDNIPIKNKIINNKFYNLKFITRGLPDAGWNLELCKNKKYYYTEWSGWSGKSKILDAGSYTIIDNLIILKSKNKNNNFSSRKYYIYKIKKNNKQYYDDFMLNNKYTYCITYNKIILPK